MPIDKWKYFSSEKRVDFPLGDNIIFKKILIRWICSILCSYVVFISIILFDMFSRSNDFKRLVIEYYSADRWLKEPRNNQPASMVRSVTRDMPERVKNNQAVNQAVGNGGQKMGQYSWFIVYYRIRFIWCLSGTVRHDNFRITSDEGRTPSSVI